MKSPFYAVHDLNRENGYETRRAGEGMQKRDTHGRTGGVGRTVGNQ